MTIFPPWITAATAAAFDREFPPMTCAVCRDETTEPADCPDRHGWEDHCLACSGTCPACQHRIDEDYL